MLNHMDFKVIVHDDNGNAVNYAVAASMMDDEIREELHVKLAPCDEQTFFDAYLKAHKEKFNEDFIIN